ncbi:hypothetical protein [Mycobacterium heckeshornense]|uniref:hypothetical protein n=1 Tax=Mycobacterium heckeshornense TaxID=110505 RepID=UPI000671DD56|nr:hypothetical protein [Mycobacterium heckeshornense]KMV23314.1 hypothetical protein ACT16_06450 [Mycobacterium heckeshornense]
MRLIGQLIAVLLLVGIIAHFIWWIVGFTCLALAIWAGRRACGEILAARHARLRQLAELAARADQQHAWVLAGDERGIYGNYPPAIDCEKGVHT